MGIQPGASAARTRRAELRSRAQRREDAEPTNFGGGSPSAARSPDDPSPLPRGWDRPSERPPREAEGGGGEGRGARERPTGNEPPTSPSAPPFEMERGRQGARTAFNGGPGVKGGKRGGARAPGGDYARRGESGRSNEPPAPRSRPRRERPPPRRWGWARLAATGGLSTASAIPRAFVLAAASS